MKKTSLIVIVLITVMNLFSCRKEKEEVLYSCDPGIHAWAVSARTFTASISRDSLAVIDLDTQFAIFRSLPDEDKIRIYNEKIDLVLEKENLTQREITHLEGLRSFMDVKYYDPLHVKDLEIFYEDWKTYAIDSLGWDTVRIGWTVETWLTSTEVAGLIAARPSTGSPASLPDCECLYDWYCGGPFTGDCKKGGCDVVGGCGVFSSSNCRGRCKPEP